MSKYGLIDKTTEGRMRAYFPHFMNGDVPLQPAANEQWRYRVFATSNYKDQQALKRMPSEDLLWWMAGFCSVYDAGDESGVPGRLSAIPSEFQIELMTALWSAVYDKRSQIRVVKPRRMRATWSVIMLLQHMWQFMGERQALVGSHREEEVDGTVAVAKAGRFVGEWSRLLPKMDYVQLYQPKWMLPNGFIPRQEPYRTRMKVVNPETGAIIWGTSASSTAAHGERGWLAYWDEAALTENLYDIITGLSAFSPCKIWTSTVSDLSHPFSTILKDAPTIMQVKLHWSMNPEYTEGLSVDPQTGKKTSPWFERRCADLGFDRTLINKVLEADETVQEGCFYGGAPGRPNCLTTMFGLPGKQPTVQPYVRRGELVIIDSKEGPKATGWLDQPNGRWRLWRDLDKDGRFPDMKLLWGADIAAGGTDDRGMGKSNSVLVAGEHQTLDVVATFVAHGLVPYEFAQVAAAGLRWLGRGREFFGSFENNGPGKEFGDVLKKRLKYQEIHCEVKGEGSTLGWYKGGDENTLDWFSLHRQMICEGSFVERDEDCAMEMREFQYNPIGRGPPIYLPSMTSPDPSGARENHGDRTIARIAMIVASKSRPFEKENERHMPPAGSADWFEMKDQMEADEGVPIMRRRVG